MRVLLHGQATNFLGAAPSSSPLDQFDVKANAANADCFDLGAVTMLTSGPGGNGSGTNPVERGLPPKPV